MNPLNPQDLLSSLADFVQIDADVYPYVPDNPTVPAVCAYVESWPFDYTADVVVVLLCLAGTVDAKDAWSRLNGWLEGPGSILEQIDSNNTLDGTVSSVLPLEVRNIGYSAPDGRPRLLQAEIVLNVLR